jgi:sugar phosphate isomerase/epimerase
MIGVTSVTFRNLSPEKIIALAKSAGLQGIEWGGDIHVPPAGRDPAGNPIAVVIGEQTRAAGLAVLSYGSYYKLCIGQDFAPVFATARALKAPLIRIWAGTIASASADDVYYHNAARELRNICARAADAGIRIGLEYHPETLTDTAGSAEKLVRLTDRDNLTLYWQPNPNLPYDEHHREITLLLPWISQIHVFYLNGGNRRPLVEGEAVWKGYIGLLGANKNYIMEFVQDDREENFLADAPVIRRISHVAAN